MKTYYESIILFLCIFQPLYAQKNLKNKIRIPDSTTVQILTTTDGSRLNGRVIEFDEKSVRFASSVGIVQIPVYKIKDIEEISTQSIVEGEYWFPNPNKTRLLFAPTGHTLEKGKGYVQDIYVVFVGCAYGLTDNITIGGGTSLIPGLQSSYYFTPKVGFEATKYISFAAGSLIIKPPESKSTYGIHYGVGTVGTADANITVGAGYSYLSNNIAHRPIFVIGAELRQTKRTAIVTENWFIPGTDRPLISLGMRFFGEGIAADLGIVRPMVDLGPIGIGIPYVDFVFNF